MFARMKLMSFNMTLVIALLWGFSIGMFFLAAQCPNESSEMNTESEQKETGEKETGEKETGEKETGEKETNQNETRTYTIEFSFLWNEESNGGRALLVGAHFTEVFIAVHNGNYKIYERGQKATKGLESLAETGLTSSITNEANGNIGLGGSVYKTFRTSSSGAVGTVTQDIEVTNEFPYIGFASMLAPSPDWFVGSALVQLHDGTSFKSLVEGHSNIYDSGTEEGDRFSLSNANTEPQGVVTRLTSLAGIPFDGDMTPLLRYKITLKK